MTWSLTIPLSSAGVSASVDAGGVVRGNWESIETWQGVEHYPFGNALSGTHKESTMAAMDFAPAATSASSAESGALWLDSGSGEISVYTSGGWYNIAKQQFKVRASLTTTLGLAVATSTLLTFDTVESSGDFDALSAYSTLTNTLTLPQSGYYLVRASVLLSSDSRNYYKKLEVRVNGTEVASTKKYGQHSPQLTVSDICKLNASDAITIYVTNNDTQIASALDRDLEVFRL